MIEIREATDEEQREALDREVRLRAEDPLRRLVQLAEQVKQEAAALGFTAYVQLHGPVTPGTLAVAELRDIGGSLTCNRGGGHQVTIARHRPAGVSLYLSRDATGDEIRALHHACCIVEPDCPFNSPTAGRPDPSSPSSST